MGAVLRIVLVAGCGFILALGCSSSNPSSSGAAKGGPNAFGNADGKSSGAGSGATFVRTDGEGQPCDTVDATRACCEGGHQTCMSSFEFTQWGPCMGSDGKQLICTDGPGDECNTREFSQFCTPPPPHDCDVELYPDCNSDGGTPPPPSLCSNNEVNNEPEILAGYSPAEGESVSQGDQIQVWVNDEWPELIAPNEEVDPATGAVLTPGDREAKAPDGYLWEPALYIAPLTAESGGPPHFPQYIKGWYNNVPPANGVKPKGGKMAQVVGSSGASVDTAPAGVSLREKYTTELVWNVDALGLGPGTYSGEFVIGDGDLDRAVGCVTIVITR